MKIYGIKEPGIENQKTLTKIASKYKFDTSGIVTVNSKDFLHVLNGQSIPDGAIYDQNGKYIEYRESDTSCNAGLFQFIPLLNPKTTYNKPDSADLKTVLKKFRDLKGNVLSQPDPADFYLLIYWSAWTGKLNKDHVKAWEDLASSNKFCKIRVIKINLDIQEYWEQEERDKILNLITRKSKKPQTSR